MAMFGTSKVGRLYFIRKLDLVFHLNSEILAKLFNLIYYLILTLTPQLSPNPNCKSQITVKPLFHRHLYLNATSN